MTEDGTQEPGGSGGADLVVGVDAGGTSTRAALADSRGRVLGTGRAGAGNALSVPVPELARTLALALAGAVPEGERGRVRAVVAGFAGATTQDTRGGGRVDGGGHADGGRGDGGKGGPRALTALAEALGGLGMAPGTVLVCGDVEAAFTSAPGAPRDGIVLIAGTGAVAARLAGRRPVAVVDGHGWLLGDAGSGFWIGRRAVRAVLRALDGRGRWTVLVPAVTAALLGRPLDALPAGAGERHVVTAAIVRVAQSRPPALLGLLAPLVVTAAAGGDPTASRILDGAAGRLTAAVGALGPRAGETLVTSGGLLGPNGPLLPRVRARTAALGLDPVSVADGVQGACTLAAEAWANATGQAAAHEA